MQQQKLTEHQLNQLLFSFFFFGGVRRDVILLQTRSRNDILHMY